MNLENAYALIIGVGADLPQTVQDATAVANVLKDPLRAGYLEENVVLLTEKEATNERIISELKKLKDKLKNTPNSTTVIYYSGHGIQYFDSTNASSYYLCTSGYNLYNRDQTMLKGDLFSSLVNEIPSEKLLIMLDCCHASGIFSNTAIVAKNIDAKITKSNTALLKKLSGGNGRIYLSSCRDNEESAILQGSDISLFTEVVLEAFSGKAGNKEDYVRAIHFLTYVLTEVPKRAEMVQHQQTPIINALENLSPDYYLCKTAKIDSIVKNLSINTSSEEFQKLVRLYSRTSDNSDGPHFLHQFPRGPMIEGHKINREIIKAFANTIPREKSMGMIQEANSFRISADIGDPKMTILQPMDLLSPSDTPPYEFWTDTFHQACLNGPRMLAALLYVIPDTQFPAAASTAKKHLLEYLKTHR